MAIDFPQGATNLPDADPDETLQQMHGGQGHAVGTNRILLNLRQLATKLGLGAGAPGATQAVLRRTAAGASGWDLVRAGDYGPLSVGSADLAGSIAVGKLAHVGANNILKGGATGSSQNVAGQVMLTDIAAAAVMTKIKEIPIVGTPTFADFTNIPQTFRSLALEYQVLSGPAASSVSIQLTSDANPTTPAWDTGGNYAYQFMQGQGASVPIGGENLTSTYIYWGNCYPTQTGVGRCVLPNYTGGSYYHWAVIQVGLRVDFTSGQLYCRPIVGQWRNPAGGAPIRGVRIAFSSPLVGGGVVSLWGMP